MNARKKYSKKFKLDAISLVFNQQYTRPHRRQRAISRRWFSNESAALIPQVRGTTCITAWTHMVIQLNIQIHLKASIVNFFSIKFASSFPLLIYKSTIQSLAGVPNLPRIGLMSGTAFAPIS